jgi:hypothetical protein
MSRQLSRRTLLRGMGVGALDSILAACVAVQAPSSGGAAPASASIEAVAVAGMVAKHDQIHSHQ